MDKKSVSIKWFPPSWLLIRTTNKVVYIDPAWIQKNFNSYPKKIIFSHYPEPMDGLPEPDLPKVDFILITHHHQDHVKTATIKRLATGKTKIYAPAKCAELISQQFNEIKVDDQIIENGIKIKAVFAYNTPEGKSTRKVHHKGEGVGYLLTVNGKTIYHAGDTDFIPEMRGLGDVDVALLPIGGTFTMDIEEAIEAVVAIKPRVVIPMHHLKVNPQEYRKKVEAVSNIKVITLEIGEFMICKTCGGVRNSAEALQPCPSGHITADKRLRFTSPKPPSATSFLLGTLYAMLCLSKEVLDERFSKEG